MRKPRKARRFPVTRSVGKLSATDWRDIYDALMDAANVHHSGAWADRIVDLARRIREDRLI